MEKFEEGLPESVRKKGEEVIEFMRKWKPQTQMWDDVLITPPMAADAAKYAYKHWKPRKGDVFIVAYPKCGLHWMAAIVKNIYAISDPEMMEFLNLRGKGILDSQGWLESASGAKFAVMDYFSYPRILCTHLCEKLVNFKSIKENGAKIIYVYRNPKDLVVSSYHFLKNVNFGDEYEYLKSLTWEEFFTASIAGEIPYSVPVGEWYPYHVKSWWKHKREQNVLFVAFEDMKKDLMSEVRKLAQFLGIDRTAKEIGEIVEKCGFENMKNSQTQLWRKMSLLRKGEVGDWKKWFTVSQSEHMDRVLEDQLAGVDILFQYET